MNVDEKIINRTEGIINSMTPQETDQAGDYQKLPETSELLQAPVFPCKVNRLLTIRASTQDDENDE
ncbi:MAG: hypothetical protein P0107_04945 [Nitrosomonas sp.]|nr:hypothetical protein [Nitrosomonas sp.]